MSNIQEHEEKILNFWEKEKIFEKTLEKTKNKKPYVFYDGPPFATGLPHYGHILSSVLKDAIPRFWTMNKRYVRRVWGWDCHGLPVENIAEKELEIKTKDQIEEMGVKKFNNFCKNKVLTYVSEWKKTVRRIARWTIFDDSYKTMDNNYIESVWWAFKKIYEKGLIYEGEKILMYCPRCETPLAKSEISMDNSYKTVKDETITVKFKLKNQDAYALAWTTTPWTLPSNLALTVNPKLKYSYIKDKSDNTTYLLAKDLIKNYFRNEGEYETIKEVTGKELINTEYEPLFPYFKNTPNAFKIITADFVTAEDGTGIVHTAPAFGEDDYNVCKKNNIGLIQPVDKSGKFTEEVKDFLGMNIFEANKKIMQFLKEKGKIVKIEKKEHEYPFCYRCETPLIYRAIPSWFVNIQKIKSKLIKLNNKINWYPEFLKEGRFKHNIETAPDWNISRNRYWATAIPIWKCECNQTKVIGSIDELRENAIKLPKEIDLHKDFLDKIKLKCKCGKEMARIPEVLDCWFESGSMPFAQFHYPFENKKMFENNFPSQFVSEYIAQTRTWYYYMLTISAILFNEIPFENVLTTGTILAEDGTKMSKSKRNFPDPWKLFEKYGVDSIRFYLLSSVLMNADNLNFSEKEVDEVYKKVLLLMYNSNRFYEAYKTNEIKQIKPKEIIDKWIISRLNETIKEVTTKMKEYNTIKSCIAIRNFVDDLSTWYIRRTRDRFNQNDQEAVQTLKFVLNELSKISAPIMPFIAEKIYQTTNNEKESVHLQEWPKFEEKKIDKKITENMKKTREIVSLALKERDLAQISLKQPLTKLTITGTKIPKEYLNLILEETNVKKIELKKGKELQVKLDTKLTPELEQEGFAREISRRIQAARKKAGLNKGDKISLAIESEISLDKQKEFIKERTDSEKITINNTDGKYDNTEEFEVKGKKFKILFTKL
jgi:isoleucyl-tRNA synthetase